MWQLVFANIFYSGMGHWLWSAWLHWWFWSCLGHPCPLCWNCPEITHVQWCWSGHVWVMALSYVLWTFQQMFCLTPLCTLYHSPSCHTYICKSLPSSLVCYPCLLGGLGAPWWYWLLRKTFLCHVFCRGFCSFHSILSYRAPLCKVYSSCLSS